MRAAAKPLRAPAGAGAKAVTSGSNAAVPTAQHRGDAAGCGTCAVRRFIQLIVNLFRVCQFICCHL